MIQFYFSCGSWWVLLQSKFVQQVIDGRQVPLKKTYSYRFVQFTDNIDNELDQPEMKSSNCIL